MMQARSLIFKSTVLFYYHQTTVAMKILKQDINVKTAIGVVVLQAEEEEDMYLLYNLICVGDQVEASTVRNVVTESKSGARDKTRVMTKITIRVESIEFDAEQCSLRLKGSNIKENDHLKLGQYHTLSLELHRPCEITKDNWDSVRLELVKEMAEPTKKAELAAVVMQEGLAHVCLVKASLSKTCAKIERTMPKKRQQGNQAYDAAVSKFFSDIYEAVKRNVNFEVVKVVLVGSPGFLNQDFLSYMQERAVREEDVMFIKHKAKFLKAHTSSGHKHAVEEMLGSAELQSQLGDVGAVGEVKALQSFHEMLANDSDRACYGIQQVENANEQLAISDLLITDTMYRCNDYVLRNKYVQLIESVKANGGNVFKFSSLHGSGEQLNLYTGIAATLRFPLPDIAELKEGGVQDSDSDDDAVGKLKSAQLRVYDDMEDFR